MRDEPSDEEIVVRVEQNDVGENRPAEGEEEASAFPLIVRDDDGEDELVDEDVDPITVSMTLALKFQRDVLEDLIADDSLLILSKGLGLIPIAANLLHALCSPAVVKGKQKNSLVVLLNASASDNDKIAEELAELAWLDDEEAAAGARSGNPRPFHVITSDSYSVDSRSRAYHGGGIMSVTSRILIVDLLSGILSPSKVTGLVVLHAEKVNELSSEHFIVDIYREKNKWGFVKALSDEPEEFGGFQPLSRKLKELKLKKILLRPRMHIDVSSSLATRDPTSVVEIEVQLTDKMRQIEAALRACLKKCVEELRRKNKELVSEFWDEDQKEQDLLDPKFVGRLHMVFDPQWHRISFESRQLLKDIKLLKDLLRELNLYDCVDFYESIQLVLDANKPSLDRFKNSESPWLMAEESQTVISLAKKRVLNQNQYVLEECPKWEQLALLLDDIAQDRVLRGTKLGPTLIMCSNSRVSRQLQRVVAAIRQVQAEPQDHDTFRVRSYSARRLMMHKLGLYMRLHEANKSVTSTIQQSKISPDDEGPGQEIHISKAFARGPITTKRRRARGGSAVAAVQRLRNALPGEESIDLGISQDDVEMELLELESEDGDEAEAAAVGEAEAEAQDEPGTGPLASASSCELVPRDSQIIIGTYDSQDSELLSQLIPSYIVLYEPNLEFVRRIEVFQATFKDNQAQTYFMYYRHSYEEELYLKSIRRDKEIFTRLIKERSSLASRFETDQDSKRINLRKQILNTRIAGGNARYYDEAHEFRVVVDTREFRAPLPGLLHKCGIRVLPAMLTVGDYIITPKVCVERKSLKDLIGSFTSGRIFDQCARMSRYYELPALLIEFDSNESFSFEPFSEYRIRSNKIHTPDASFSNKMKDDIQLQLAQLVIRFPRLRILWSSSPLQTSELIMDLKSGREEPNLLDAINAGLKEEKKKQNVELNENLVTLLNDLPGNITDIDKFKIMKKFKSIDKLVGVGRDEISAVVGEELGDRIFEYLESNYKK